MVLILIVTVTGLAVLVVTQVGIVLLRNRILLKYVMRHACNTLPLKSLLLGNSVTRPCFDRQTIYTLFNCRCCRCHILVVCEAGAPPRTCLYSYPIYANLLGAL